MRQASSLPQTLRSERWTSQRATARSQHPGPASTREMCSSDTRAGSFAPRKLDRDAGAEVAFAFFESGEDVERAAWHFARALELWDPRALAPTAGHLWIAAETLGPFVEARCVALEGKSDWRELAAAWSLTGEREGALHAKTTNQALIREVFNGDKALFKALRELANAWEHGYRSLGALREQATALVDDAARQMRESLLRLIDVEDPHKQLLSGAAFETPVGLWSLATRLEGTVDGPTDAFAPLAEPIEPEASISVSVMPAAPPFSRTLSFSTQLGAGGSHPDGVTITPTSSALVAPSGARSDEHRWEGATVALNDQVVEEIPPPLIDSDATSDGIADPEDAGAGH